MVISFIRAVDLDSSTAPFGDTPAEVRKGIAENGYYLFGAGIGPSEGRQGIHCGSHE